MIGSIIFLAVALLFEAVAAAANAKMDTVKDHYSVSVYNNVKFDPNWYNPAISWNEKNNKAIDLNLQKKYLPIWLRWLSAIKPGWDPISDFWHQQKTTMLFFQTLALVACSLSKATYLQLGLFIFIDGLVWVGVFNYFYQRKLKK